MFGVFAFISLVLFLLLLGSCAVCPDEQCPVLPNAAPRQ
jgi:hypothetical protein